jgi:hypothetical protein
MTKKPSGWSNPPEKAGFTAMADPTKRPPVTSEELQLLATPNEELKERAYKFSFDEDLFSKRISGGERWQQLLQAHLYYDHVLTQMLVDALPQPDAIELQRMGFVNKLQLIAAMSLLPSEVISPIGFINGIRNKISHDLSFEITDQTVTDLQNCTPTSLREAAEKEKGRTPGPLLFHELLRVVLLMAEVKRQENEFNRITSKKGEVRLRTVLEKTPGVVYKK